MKTRFIHWTGPYQDNSAGIRLTHYYAHIMRLCGFESYITSQGNPQWYTPQLEGSVLSRDIVIYPEALGLSNLLNATNIVRFFLYFPTAYWNGAKIPSNEFCLSYLDYFNKECLDHGASNITNLPIGCVEPNLFNNIKVKSELPMDVVYYVGKGTRNYPSKHLPPHATEIRNLDRRGVAEVLKRSRTLYTFDPHSAIIEEARLCGCNVWVLQGDDDPAEPTWRWPIMNEDKDKELARFAAIKILKFFGKTMEDM